MLLLLLLPSLFGLKIRKLVHIKQIRRPGYHLCQTILKLQDVIVRNVIIKRIAIVKFTANKSSCNSFGESKRQIPAITQKVTNMLKAATTS